MLHVSTACAASSAAPSWAGCRLVTGAGAAGSSPLGSVRVSIARPGWSPLAAQRIEHVRLLRRDCPAPATGPANPGRGRPGTGAWSRTAPGRPTVSRWPITSTQPRSSSCLRISALIVTPRMSSMSPRVHRLAVGDDGQRLEHRTGVAWAAFPGAGGRGTRASAGRLWKRQPLATLHQFDAALGPFVLQVREQRLDRVGAQFVIEQDAQLAHRQRLLRANQGGFEDALGIRRIHGLAVPGKGAIRRANQKAKQGRFSVRCAAGNRSCAAHATRRLAGAWLVSHSGSL